jgi:hypothetical protein
MDVIAEAPPQGDRMNTPNVEEIAQVTGAERSQASKKGRVGAQRAHVAPKKGKTEPKAKTAQKAPKSAKNAVGSRDGSKAAVSHIRRSVGADS